MLLDLVLTDNCTEKLNQWGLLLSVFTYGSHVALFFKCLKSLSRQRNRRLLLIGYTVVLFVLATVAIALQIWWTQVAFVDNRLYPGGPTQFLLDNSLSAPNRALTTMYILMNWLADSLILYRFYVLCKCEVIGGRPIALLFVIPCSLALIVTAIVFFPNIAGLGVSRWTNSVSVGPGIAYMALSLCVNTTLTLLIVCRLLLIRRSFRRTLGPHHGQPYTSIVALLIESASLYTIIALMTVITCGVGSPIQYALLPMLGQLQAIPPLLIATRVAEGLALSKSTYSQLSSHVKFSPGSPIRSLFTTFTTTVDSPITPIKPTLKLALPKALCSWQSLSQDAKEKPHELEWPSVISVLGDEKSCYYPERHRCSDLCRDFCLKFPGVQPIGDVCTAV